MDRVSHLSGYDRERVCVPQVCDCKQRDCRYQRFLKTCDKDHFLFQICNHTVLDAVKLFTSSQTDMIFYTAEDVSTGGAMLCAAADDITQRMKKILWQPDQAFVLTSGTMAVGSDFRRFKTQAGLEKGHRVMESVSPSPFDYRNNGLLYLPQIPPRQRVEDTDVYFNELTAELVGLIKAASGHALVLFTSYAAMSAVKERLWEESLPFPLLTLGRNAHHIIEQFRHTPGAVLLATGAAWEGFDFPGDCVSLLIIPRLPFAYRRKFSCRRIRRGGCPDPFL